jgi:hypothetical protein
MNLILMANLDDTIGKLLLDLQKDDPDAFKKIMKKAYEEDPKLFENDIDEDNKTIDEYNRNVEEYNKKIEND